MVCKSFGSDVFIVLDLLFDSDIKTSRRIDDAIYDSINISKSKLESRRVKCDSPDMFIKEINNIKDDIVKRGKYPFIHIDGHGSDDHNSLAFPDGTFLDYNEVTKYFREINHLCHNNLFVTSGACNFAYVLTKNITISKTSPVFCILAPEQKVQDTIMEQGFVAFFNRFIQSGGNLVLAHEAFCEKVDCNDYAFLLAEVVLNKSLESAQNKTLKGNAKYVYREKILSECLRLPNNQSNVTKTRNFIKKKLKTNPLNIKKIKKTFLMIDSCQDNLARFKDS